MHKFKGGGLENSLHYLILGYVAETETHATTSAEEGFCNLFMAF